MNRCILHVGMPKTGTSSIQETLYFGLKDPNFAYFSAGEVNGTRMLWTVAAQGNLPSHHWHWRVTDERFAIRKKKRYRRMLCDQLHRARRRQKTLILSGEDCWNWEAPQIQQFLKLLSENQTDVQVIAYVRPWKSFLESNFQEMVKGRTQFIKSDPSVSPLPPIQPIHPKRIDYRLTIESLESNFGKENLILRKYEPKDFPNGCVVRDFCNQTGASIAPNSVRRSNDSIGLNAVRMLYAYKSFGHPEIQFPQLAIWQHFQLTLALRDMPDTPFRFHSEITNPILEPYLEQIPWLEDRLGGSFREDFEKHDDSPCIRSMEDFFRFDETSLRWLASRTKCQFPKRLQGEQTAKEVAKMIHFLRHQIPHPTHIAMSFRRFVGRAWMRSLYSR